MIGIWYELIPDQVVQTFGLDCDRRAALSVLLEAGGWSAAAKTPSISKAQEGVMRPMCDITLLAFYLVISSIMQVSLITVPICAAEN